MQQLNGDRLVQGDGKQVSVVINALSGSLIDCEIEFFLALQLPRSRELLLVLSRTSGEISVEEETGDRILASFTIPSGATATLTVPPLGATLLFDLKVIPAGGDPFTRQGEIRLMAALEAIA